MSLRSTSTRDWQRFMEKTHQSLSNGWIRAEPYIAHGIRMLAKLGAEWFPKIERAVIYIAVESVAIPRIILQQLVAMAVLRGTLTAVNLMHDSWTWILSTVTSHGRTRRLLKKRMAKAGSYGEWRACAKNLDRHESNETWRQERSCDLYDSLALQQRIDELNGLVDKGDTFSLIFKLRGAMSRTAHGLLHEGLYNHAYAGTKVQVSEYHKAVCRALEAICGDDENEQGAALSSSSFSPALAGCAKSGTEALGGSSSSSGGHGDGGHGDGGGGQRSFPKHSSNAATTAGEEAGEGPARGEESDAPQQLPPLRTAAATMSSRFSSGRWSNSSVSSAGSSSGDDSSNPGSPVRRHPEEHHPQQQPQLQQLQGSWFQPGASASSFSSASLGSSESSSLGSPPSGGHAGGGWCQGGGSFCKDNSDSGGSAAGGTGPGGHSSSAFGGKGGGAGVAPAWSNAKSPASSSSSFHGNGNGTGGEEFDGGGDSDSQFEGGEKPPIPTDVKLAFFNETRHAYGRTALCLSGGAALGFYHVGLLSALMRERLMPRVISGASAGSIMCAVLGTHTDAELRHIFDTADGMRLDFIKPLQETIEHPVFRFVSGCYDQGLYRTRGAPPVTLDPRHPGGIRLRTKKKWRRRGRSKKDGKKKKKRAAPLDGKGKASEKDRQKEEEEDEPEEDEEEEEADHGPGLVFPPLVGMIVAGPFLYPWAPLRGLKCDTEHLASVIRTNCGGDLTFQEAFDRTGRIINLTVSPNEAHRPMRLLNYLTAPHVLVWSAATASSAVPGIFKPQALLVKDLDGTIRPESRGGYHSDGSVTSDLPMDQLSELFNVNHFIVSQINPHGVALSTLSCRVGVTGTMEMRMKDVSLAHKVVVALITFLRSQLRAWGLGVLKLLSRRNRHEQAAAMSAAANVITQMYEGRSGHDISILPWSGELSMLTSCVHLMDSPSVREFRRMMAVGEANTWPKLPRIHAHCDIEVTLERCVQKLRRRLAHESALRLARAVNRSDSNAHFLPSQPQINHQQQHQQHQQHAHASALALGPGNQPQQPQQQQEGSDGWPMGGPAPQQEQQRALSQQQQRQLQHDPREGAGGRGGRGGGGGRSAVVAPRPSRGGGVVPHFSSATAGGGAGGAGAGTHGGGAHGGGSFLPQPPLSSLPPLRSASSGSGGEAFFMASLDDPEGQEAGAASDSNSNGFGASGGAGAGAGAGSGTTNPSLVPLSIYSVTDRRPAESMPSFQQCWDDDDRLFVKAADGGDHTTDISPQPPPQRPKSASSSSSSSSASSSSSRRRSLSISALNAGHGLQGAAGAAAAGAAPRAGWGSAGGEPAATTTTGAAETPADVAADAEFIKTSSMSSFYYRRSKSGNHLSDLDTSSRK